MNISPMRSGLFAGPVLVAAATMMAATGAAQAACANLVAAFDKAVAARQVDAAVGGLAAIGGDTDDACLGHLKDFRVRLADFLLAYADTPGLASKDRDHAIAAADTTLLTGGYWQGKRRLADYYFAHGDKPKAHEWYKRSIAALGIPGAAPATDRQLKELMARAAGAKSLANNEPPAGNPGGSRYVSERGDDGSLGGIYSRALLRVRGAATVSVPVPINFEYNKTTFTPLGEEAMKELIDAAKGVPAMTLVGHADPQGSHAYNMELSRGRAMAVRDALIRAGIKAQITVQWKGDTEPFDVSLLPDADVLSQEDVYQLDRRVEWLRNAERP
jgi:outer membrane protein OmpA-like peptidoglycan-associated protein